MSAHIKMGHLANITKQSPSSPATSGLLSQETSRVSINLFVRANEYASVKIQFPITLLTLKVSYKASHALRPFSDILCAHICVLIIPYSSTRALWLQQRQPAVNHGVGEKRPRILLTKCLCHISQGSLTCGKALWYLADGLFPFLRKSCYGFVSPLKIHRPQPSFNPRTLGPTANTITTRPTRTTRWILRHIGHEVWKWWCLLPRNSYFETSNPNTITFTFVLYVGSNLSIKHAFKTIRHLIWKAKRNHKRNRLAHPTLAAIQSGTPT
jgi:hypothetical protein